MKQQNKQSKEESTEHICRCRQSEGCCRNCGKEAPEKVGDTTVCDRCGATDIAL